MTLKNWLSGHVDELNGELPLPPPPPIAKLVPVEHEQKAKVIAEANKFIAEWYAERDADKKVIGELRGEIAELVLTLQSEKRKNGVLEVDLATAANNAVTLQSTINEMRHYMTLTRGLWDKWEIKTPPKKPRPPRKKKESVKVEIGDGHA